MNWVLDNLDLIWALTLDHLRQSLIAILLGFIVALPIGWVAFRYTRLRGPTLTTVGLLYTIPSLGLFAVLAAAFGIPLLSEANLIVALTIYAVAIMTRSVTDGLVSATPSTRAAAVAVGFGPWRRFWTVDFPLAGPVLLAGLRVIQHPPRSPLPLSASSSASRTSATSSPTAYSGASSRRSSPEWSPSSSSR